MAGLWQLEEGRKEEVKERRCGGWRRGRREIERKAETEGERARDREK